MAEIYDFGLILKNLRKSRNLTQEKLADLIGVSKTIVSRYESNTIAPPFETMRSLAAIFNVSMDYLYGTEKPSTVSTFGLTSEQKEIIESLSEEFRAINSKAKRNPDIRYDILGKIVSEINK